MVPATPVAATMGSTRPPSRPPWPTTYTVAPLLVTTMPWGEYTEETARPVGIYVPAVRLAVSTGTTPPATRTNRVGALWIEGHPEDGVSRPEVERGAHLAWPR